MAEHRGGTMRLLAAAGGSLDPQINYTLQYWQLYQATQDGLVALQEGRQGDGRPSRSCPTSPRRCPTPTNGGKTWTSSCEGHQVLRTARTSTPRDFLASFQRIFKVSSPTAGGSTPASSARTSASRRRPRCTLKGGVIGERGGAAR